MLVGDIPMQQQSPMMAMLHVATGISTKVVVRREECCIYQELDKLGVT